MRDHRHYSSEWTRGGGYTNDALKFSIEWGGAGGLKHWKRREAASERNGEFGFVHKNIDICCLDYKKLAKKS